MFNRVASCELRVASGTASLRCAPRLNAYASSLQLALQSPWRPAAGLAVAVATSRWPCSRRGDLQPYPPRTGISLLEVLIAMFVLLFGLMGVAAIFPVGNHYAGKGDQYDRGAALAGTAFAEVKSREGMLGPNIWLYPDNTSVMNGGNFQVPATAGHAFVIDPVGAAETSPADTSCNFFPYDANGGKVAAGWNLKFGTTAIATTSWPVQRITFDPLLRSPPQKFTPQVAEAIFRLHDDLTGQLPDANDSPGIQRMTVDSNGTPKITDDDIPLARSYAGNYSWLATVLPTNADALVGMQPSTPRYGSFLYEVSVAVFFKRDSTPSLTSERQLSAELGPGGDLLLYSINSNSTEVDDASQDIRPSQWILLAGVHPTSGKFLLKWYRLLALDDDTSQTQLLSNTSATVPGRHAMVEGPEWPPDATPVDAQVSTNLRAILLPGVIGVATQSVKLDTE
jgi:hypothetical protein